jgi:methylglutaconyl-CoA hydratase
MRTSASVLLSDESPLAVVTLNEPERRNPLSPAMIEGLFTTLTAIAAEDRFRAIVLTGAGHGFCAGADLRRMRTATPLADREEYNAILRVNRLLWNYPKPTVAAVHGFALGAGANLMSWCDITMAERSTQLAYPEIIAGIPSAAVIPTLLRTVGRKRMYDLILTGRRITAEEAERIGLISRVVEDGTALDEARLTAASIAEHNPEAVRLMKEIVQVTSDLPYSQSVDYAKEVRVIARLRSDFEVAVPQGGTAGSPVSGAQ